MSVNVGDDERIGKPRGRGGARPGAGRKPAGVIPDVGAVVRTFDVAMDEIQTRVDALPWLIRLLVGKLLAQIESLAVQLGPLLYQLSEHLRNLEGRLAKLQRDLDFQTLLFQEGQAAAEERNQTLQVTVNTLQASVDSLKAELSATRQEVERVRAVSEANEGQLRRIFGTVREVRTATPEREIAAAVERAVEQALNPRNLRFAQRPPIRHPVAS